MNLFNLKDVVLHSGQTSKWIIDCESLSDNDLKALAYIAQELLPPFEQVIGVPKGGCRFASALGQYASPWPGEKRHVLIVDDVCTTGNSLEEVRQKFFPTPEWGIERGENPTYGWVHGVVIFARGPLPSWCKAIWNLNMRLP